MYNSALSSNIVIAIVIGQNAGTLGSDKPADLIDDSFGMAGPCIPIASIWIRKRRAGAGAFRNPICHYCVDRHDPANRRRNEERDPDDQLRAVGATIKTERSTQRRSSMQS
jgi:hypothetical protein